MYEMNYVCPFNYFFLSSPFSNLCDLTEVSITLDLIWSKSIQMFLFFFWLKIKSNLASLLLYKTFNVNKQRTSDINRQQTIKLMLFQKCYKSKTCILNISSYTSCVSIWKVIFRDKKKSKNIHIMLINFIFVFLYRTTKCVVKRRMIQSTTI